MSEDYGNFIRGKKSPLLVISQSSLHSLDLCCNAVVCCIACCLLFSLALLPVLHSYKLLTSIAILSLGNFYFMGRECCMIVFFKE